MKLLTPYLLGLSIFVIPGCDINIGGDDSSPADGTGGEDDDDADDDPEYDFGDFLEDAVVAIVLAGTSVSQLLGQNSPSKTSKIPSPKVAIAELLSHSNFNSKTKEDLTNSFHEFVQVYDAVRHFGEAKHETIAQLTEESLCKHLTTCQDVWRFVLQSVYGRKPSTGEFDRKFEFTE